MRISPETRLGSNRSRVWVRVRDCLASNATYSAGYIVYKFFYRRNLYVYIYIHNSSS
ncbi:MAG: hypothetical protein M2R45_02569 [Verrucomicrobia subdivision 3 bacterium]|nr:hypothetical protein [Limisphaerales bacterium]MCS1414224.1 hypothetical protein [Limisphaerales bacterium]